MSTAAPLPRWRRLGVRLVLLFVLLALVMSLTFMAGMQRALGGGWRALVRPLVADYIDRLAAEIGSPPDLGRAEALVERLPLAIEIDGPVLQWRSHPDGLPRHPLPPWRRRHPPPGLGPAGDATAAGPGDVASMAGRDDGRPPFDPASAPWRHGPDARPWGPPPDEDEEAPAARVAFTRVTADGHRITFGLGEVPLRHQPRVIGWITLALLLAITALTYAAVRRLLRPLDDIRAGAVRYGQGEFDAPIPVRRQDELGRLAAQINTMASQLRDMLDAKRALLLAISHELRSPLTRARLNAELVEEGASRDALLRDLQEMGTLIADLLESERLAAGHRALQTGACDLVGLVRQAATDALLSRAEGGEAQAPAPQIALDLPEGLPAAVVDAARLRLLLRNLIGNALRHGRPLAGAAGDLTIALSFEAGHWQLVVRDHGPGASAEQRERLSEAFYRTDAARSRDTGGVGLGLYLCRLVAQAHGGQIRFEDAAPGLRVVVRWPEPGRSMSQTG